jgi:hypothetical protein
VPPLTPAVTSRRRPKRPTSSNAIPFGNVPREARRRTVPGRSRPPRRRQAESPQGRRGRPGERRNARRAAAAGARARDVPRRRGSWRTRRVHVRSCEGHRTPGAGRADLPPWLRGSRHGAARSGRPPREHVGGGLHQAGSRDHQHQRDPEHGRWQTYGCFAGGWGNRIATVFNRDVFEIPWVRGQQREVSGSSLPRGWVGATRRQ